MHEGGRYTTISNALDIRNATGPRGLKSCGLIPVFVTDRASFPSLAVPTTDVRAPYCLARSQIDDAFLW